MKTFYFLLTGIILFISCKKEVQPQMSPLNEDCDCANAVSAEFVIEEMTTGNLNFARYTETDKIFGNKNVRFYAKEENAEYTWYIGNEILNTREVKRYFENSMVGQSIPITLVVKKNPNSICFPNDDGYDSLIHYFSVAQLDLYYNYDTTFLEGIYRMKSPLLTDSVDIIIDYRLYSNGMNQCFDIYNYDGSGTNILNKIISFTWAGLNYKQLWFKDLGGSLNHLEGDIHVRMDNIVEMNFIEREYNGSDYDTTKKYLYRGRKL